MKLNQPPAAGRKNNVASRTENISAIRKAGLDLCDAMLGDLCSVGLLAVTPQSLTRLQEYRESLRSHKLMRFSNEVAALRSRFEQGLEHGDLTAPAIAGRLCRLQQASARLRSLLDDPAADQKEIEEIAGKTWREGDLERLEDQLLAEMAWESLHVEEGFRIDTSYFLARGGTIDCERKIVPLGVPVADTSLKAEYPGARLFPAIGLYPGDEPRRIRILAPAPLTRDTSPATTHAAVLELIEGAPTSIEDLRDRFLARWRRPFPPETFPVLLAHPHFIYQQGQWRVAGSDGASLPAAAPPGTGRTPPGGRCLAAFEDCVLTAPIQALLLLLHDNGEELAAAPIGAITSDSVIRFGLDPVE